MTTTPKEDYSFNSGNLFFFLLKWRKPLIAVVIGAAIISAIVAMLITPKFQSTVILFPAKTNSVSKALLAESFGAGKDILQFGQEEEAEQVLQILSSDEIRDRICEKYHLMKHYEINSDNPRTDLRKEFEDNISFKRTPFQSVRIDVLDKDPEMASAMANDISALLDSVKNRMQSERAVEALKIVEHEYRTLKKEVKQMEDSITSLRKMGIHEYEVQIEMFTEQYSKAIADGNMRAIQVLEEKLNVLAEYGSSYISLRDNLVQGIKRLSLLNAKYDEAKVDAHQNMPHKFVVDRAFPAEKKTYPIRWLIVVVSVISSFLLAVLIIIGIENLRKFQQQNTENKHSS